MTITTYTAGPAQSMNRRMVSMPVQNSAACATQRIAYEIQPSASSPRKLTCVSAWTREELQEDDVQRLGGEVGLHAVPGHRDEPADDGGDVRPLTPKIARLITG